MSKSSKLGISPEDEEFTGRLNRWILASSHSGKTDSELKRPSVPSDQPGFNSQSEETTSDRLKSPVNGAYSEESLRLLQTIKFDFDGVAINFGYDFVRSDDRPDERND